MSSESLFSDRMIISSDHDKYCIFIVIDSGRKCP
jgi:hypothetical protein